MEEVVSKSEEMAKKMNTVAHHYDHEDKVRKEVIELAKEEGLEGRDIFLLEIAALWHDIGLDYVDDRSKHPEKSAEMFVEEFKDDTTLSEAEVGTVVFLLKHHDKYQQARELTTDEKLLQMLRILIDADTLELLGERGYVRALETAEDRKWPNYDEGNPLGETNKFTAAEFDQRFKLKREGRINYGIEPTLVGQINFQISCADLLFTKSAQDRAANGVAYLKEKIQEIVSGQTAT